MTHATVRCLNKTITVHTAVSCQTADQTDIWPFRCLNRTDSTIVTVVNIADFKAGAFTAQATGTQR